MNLLETLETIRTSTLQELSQEQANPEEILGAVLGRKGSLTAILRQLSSLALEERKEVGARANAIKQELESAATQAAASKISTDIMEGVDPTVPAYHREYGSLHPINSLIHELIGIFNDLSFEVVEGREIVSDWENFESLNFTADHPARESHDTFYLEDSRLLRTHTSSVQVQEMKRRLQNKELPIRFVVPGKTYRRDSDATHSPMFHQFEGVMVDNITTFADLKGVLDFVAKRLFGNTVETRFRTHYFPFTEPSAEMDIRWKDEGRKDPSSGWIEWLGCGMIHPNVLEAAGINPRIYQGWAFGGGIERPVIIRHQIPDMRKLFDNSVDLLDQFGDTL